ncbi:MAG: DNA polymerase III subunit delta [Armatimonadota bacterium]
MPPRKTPKRTVAYLLWGQEELRKKEALAALLDELVPPEDRDLDVEYIDAGSSGVSGETILHAARDRAMFSERRVVVVTNAGKLKGGKHQRTQEVLADGLRELPDYSTVIFVAYAEEGGGRSRSVFGEKLMAALKAVGEVRQFTLMKPEELAQLAVREAELLGKKLAPAAAAQLAQRVGTDSQRLLHETRKLAAYVGDRATISPADVNLLVAAPPDDNVFHLLDATMAGNRAQALDLLRQLRESDVAAQQVMAMLARTLRQVAQAAFLRERGILPKAEGDEVPPEVLAMLPEDGSLYRGGSAWLRGRLWEQAGRISWDRLQQALDRLAVADAGSKGWEHGVADPDLALEMLVISLSDSVRSTPPTVPRAGGYGGYGGKRPAYSRPR